MKWTWGSFVTSPTFLAASAHVGWAAFVVSFAGHWLGGLPALGAFLTFWALPKEFVLDLLPPPYGEGDTFGSSLQDFAWYAAGSGLGLFAWWVTT